MISLMEKQKYFDFKAKSNRCDHLLYFLHKIGQIILSSGSCVGKRLTPITDITVLIAFASFEYLLEN